MRPTLIALALVANGCLVEYVLPGGDSSGDQGNTENSPTGEPAPTTGTGTVDLSDDGQVTGEECDADLCGDECVDLTRNGTHCGACDEFCNDDQQCIASECRDILVVECAACPCEACSAGEGLLEPTTSDGGEPSNYLCCPPVDDADPVVCVVGDLEDVLVCPEDQERRE